LGQPALQLDAFAELADRLNLTGPIERKQAPSNIAVKQ
jgi:hypothetical protein